MVGATAGRELCRKCRGDLNPMYPDSVFLTHLCALPMHRGWLDISTMMDQRTFKPGGLAEARALLLAQVGRSFDAWWAQHGPRDGETDGEYRARIAEQFSHTPEGVHTERSENSFVSVRPQDVPFGLDWK